jgi:uncharacterized protein with FMN-binding domain
LSKALTKIICFNVIFTIVLERTGKTIVARKQKNATLGKFIEAFAWLSLILAFFIGQIAAEKDYTPLINKAYPKHEYQISEVYASFPLVFHPSPERIDEAVVIAEGQGYGGPFILGVKAHKTDNGAVIDEIQVLSHKETPPYLQKLFKKNFFRQYMNKNITNNLLFGDDIDGISGATVTSKSFNEAIRKAMHTGASNQLKLEKTWQDEQWQPGINELGLVLLFLVVYVVIYAPRRIAKPFKLLLPFAALAYVGFYTNSAISLGSLAGIVLGYVPEFSQHPLWWIMFIGLFGGIIILGKNTYCNYLCPFSHVEDLLQKISGIKLTIKKRILKNARKMILFLTWLALMLIFLSTYPALGSYEPFSMMFSLSGMGIQWYILPLSLFGSFLIPQFWCRLFCPVGVVLTELVRIRRKIGDFFGKAVSTVSSRKNITPCDEKMNAQPITVQEYDPAKAAIAKAREKAKLRKQAEQGE